MGGSQRLHSKFKLADQSSRISKRSKAPLEQQKPKPSRSSTKKKRKLYADKELGLPQLNMINPIGVQKPSGKKKGKVFVDDAESMVAILAMVNAEKEGHIESKMMKSRQTEELRNSRMAEAEGRENEKKRKLEEAKDSIRKRRKRKGGEEALEATNNAARLMKPLKARNRVSFG